MPLSHPPTHPVCPSIVPSTTHLFTYQFTHSPPHPTDHTHSNTTHTRHFRNLPDNVKDTLLIPATKNSQHIRTSFLSLYPTSAERHYYKGEWKIKGGAENKGRRGERNKGETTKRIDLPKQTDFSMNVSNIYTVLYGELRVLYHQYRTGSGFDTPT